MSTQRLVSCPAVHAVKSTSGVLNELLDTDSEVVKDILYVYICGTFLSNS